MLEPADSEAMQCIPGLPLSATAEHRQYQPLAGKYYGIFYIEIIIQIVVFINYSN